MTSPTTWDWVDKPSPIKGLMLDISGVLRDGKVPIPGSIEAFNRLITSSIPVRLVTNESQVTSAESLSKLDKLGFHIPPTQQIFAPAPLLAKELLKKGSTAYLLVHPNVEDEFKDVPKSETTPDCVVIGDAAEHFTYETMNKAFRVLLSMKKRGLEPKLYTLGRGRYYMEEGDLWMDVGPFCAALEYGLDITAECFGKPSPTFFEAALNSMDPGLLPSEVVMIGDDVVGDVGGAMNAGLRGVLVRTGKFRPGDENHPTIRPSGIVDNLAAAVERIFLGQSK